MLQLYSLYYLASLSNYSGISVSSLTMIPRLSVESFMIYLFMKTPVAYVVLILLDLSAAFDSIDHRMLFDCLEQLAGLPGSVNVVYFLYFSTFSFCCCQ